MGLPSVQLAELITRELELPLTADEYLAEVGDIHRELFPTCNLMSGIDSRNRPIISTHYWHDKSRGKLCCFVNPLFEPVLNDSRK